MKISTTLSKELQAANEKARYDEAVKNLLADRMILAWIVKSCVSEFQNVEIRKIAYEYIVGEPQIGSISVMPDETNVTSKIAGTGVEDVTVTEGTITFDIRFEAILPYGKKTVSLIINVEGQNDFYPGYPIIKRGIYYCSRMISSQYGTVFTKSHYEKIKKVYSIWICTNPPKNRENTITRYSFMEDNLVGSVKECLEYYDLIATVVVCLGKPEKESYRGLLQLLGVLLSSEMKIREKQKILEQDFDIPMTETLERQVSDMCNLSEGIMEKGRKEGSESALAASIKSLMDKLKMTAEQAMDALSIPESERQKYKALIR